MVKKVRIKRKRLQIKIIRNGLLLIKGPLGKLSFKANFIAMKRKLFFSSKAAANCFLSRVRSLLKGLIYGFFIELKTEGVGLKFMRFSTAPQLINLSLGYSHSIIYKIPQAIKFRCLKYRLLLFCNRATLLTKIAQRIRGYRPPDPYKGKGVKYTSEVLRIKPGKQRQR